MNTRSRYFCAAYLSLLLAGFSAPAPASSPPASSNADPVYSIQMSDADNAGCVMNISGNGTMKFMHACHNGNMSFLTVVKLPSTATILVSSGYCTESTEREKWWVRLQSTTRELSTEKLNISNLVTLANEWTGPESNIYVAPYLKVVGFGRSEAPTPDAQARCVAVTLPTSVEGRNDTFKLNIVPAEVTSTSATGSAASTASAEDFQYRLTCDTGPIIAEYRGVPSLDRKANGTCLQIRDFEGNAYGIGQKADFIVKVEDTPFQCPAGMALIATDSWPLNRQDRRITCGTLVNAKTKQPLKLSSPEPSRKVDVIDSLNICDDPKVGEKQRIWNSNHIPTGIDLGNEFVQYWCSGFSK